MECHKVIKRRETFVETVGYVQHTEQMQGTHRKHKFVITTSGNTVNNIQQVRTMFKLIGCELQVMQENEIKVMTGETSAPEKKETKDNGN